MWAWYQQYQLSSTEIALVNSFAELALSALNALRESETFSLFGVTVRAEGRIIN
jgi:hypothetical protein